jgi:folate-binding protein YgfZ
MNSTPSLAEEVQTVRSSVGYWFRDDYTFVRITGADAADWLHSQTTNDVKALETGHGHHNAVLDRQGRLHGHFTVHRWGDEYWMLIEQSQVEHVLEHLDAHLFIEDVTIEATGDSLEQFILQGPKTLSLLSCVMDNEVVRGTELLPQEWHHVHPIEIDGAELLAFRASMTGEDGFVLVGEPGHCAAIGQRLREADESIEVTPIGAEAQSMLRLEAGIPQFGLDMDEQSRLPETTLERTTVSYEKGCYLGQEVVARLKAYGTVKRALMGLIFEAYDTEGLSWIPGNTVLVDGKAIGELTSITYSPTLDKHIALAYLDRDHRTPDTVLSIHGKNFINACGARVVVLPFVDGQSREERAESLYHEALNLFQLDLDDKDASAIPMLQEAILLYPSYEDAYEVLGVILHRHHRVDEAIYYMLQLKELNPNCVMAHTNLSVFYVAKGMIEEAEEAKAHSDVLQMQHLSDERKAKRMAEQERARIQEEARERIGMFQEVLEIDPDDEVATFGLGKAYVQLNQHEKAIPHLLHATNVQKDFSAAFLDLGKCYEFLERVEEAKSTYEAGIAIASRKGDLMPMREMERRLKTL